MLLFIALLLGGILLRANSDAFNGAGTIGTVALVVAGLQFIVLVFAIVVVAAGGESARRDVVRKANARAAARRRY